MTPRTAYEAPLPARGIDRLFVSVGTDYHRFDRLILWLDEWLATGPDVGHVVVQRGTSADSNRADTSIDYIPRSHLIEEFQQATAVVCHGGPATILECRSNGLVPIVVPREERFDEHVNDHQVDFCERLAEHDEIQLARTKDEFFRFLELAVQRGAAQVAVDDGHTAESIGRFEEAMVGLLGDRARTTPIGDLAEVVTLHTPRATVPVLFIGSVPRSGSTIISDLLDQHPHMVNVGELVHLWERGIIDDNLCACGQRFSTCEFWGKVGEIAFGGWDRISGTRMQALKARADRTRFIPALLSPFAIPYVGTSIRQYGEVVTRVLRAAVEVSGAPVVVDTSKHVSTALLLRQMDDVDVRILHLVRDPRGVAYSWTKNVGRPEVHSTEEQMDRLHPGRIGLRWLWFNWAFSNMGRLGVQVQTVRYEDFASNPELILNQIFSFAELEPMAAQIIGEGAIELEEGHSVSGNPRRLVRGPVEIRRDDSWRSGLPRRMAGVVAFITRPMRARYRYIEES